MKKMTITLAFCAVFAATAVLAGGDGSTITPGMIEGDAAASSGRGLLIPLILLVLVAAAVAASG